MCEEMSVPKVHPLQVGSCYMLIRITWMVIMKVVREDEDATHIRIDIEELQKKLEAVVLFLFDVKSECGNIDGIKWTRHQLLEILLATMIPMF